MKVSRSIAPRRVLTLVAAVFLAMAVAIPAASGAGAPGHAPKRPRVQKISLLYVLGSATAGLKPRGGNRYTLTLKPADRETVWFSDRPSRRSGSFSTVDLPDAWAGFGFDADPPNAAVSYTDPSGTQRTSIFELRNPRHAKGSRTISFEARLLDPAGVRSGDLAARARTADRAPARRLRDVSVFIDDSSAPVIGGCVMQPHTYCPNELIGGADLEGFDLAGANFDETDFTDTTLEGADFAGASLFLAGMENASARRTNFAGADMEGAALSYGEFFAADFGGADLERANLSNAEVAGANFRGANLNGANLEGTNFCHTTMPNGTVNDSDCT